MILVDCRLLNNSDVDSERNAELINEFENAKIIK